MKIYELYFNPEKEEKFCETFHYEPQDAYQRRMGRLYMVGEINNALKSESTLLSNIFHTAKEKYYENPSTPPDKALKEALKEVNRIIEKSEYLGRVSITFISSKNLSIYMGKVGKVKAFLLSDGKIADIGKEVEESGSPIFQNIVCGKMKNKDKVVVFTSDMHKPFLQGKVLQEMTQSILDDQFMEKISTLHEKKFPQISGASLVLDYTMSIKESSLIASGKENFSFKKSFSSLGLRVKNILQKAPQMDRNKLKFIVVPLLVVVVVLGAITFARNITEKRSMEAFSAATEVIEKAETTMEEGNLGEALLLFDEAMLQLSQISTDKAKEKEEEVREHLYTLFGRKEVEEPLLLGEVEGLSGQSIAVYENKVYIFSSDEMVVMSEDGSYNTQEIPQASLSTRSNKGVMFFSGPDNLVRVIDGEVVVSEMLPPYEDYSFSSMASFNNRAYFLEENKNEIIFYGEKRPSLWIKEGEKNHGNGKDIAIDRSIFILDDENKIHRYYTGEYEEEINYSIYPFVSGIEKIHTEIDAPLFLLESKRVILLDKEGNILQQIYSESFSNLKDIATSTDGKKIYLLDDQKVYLIEL